MRTVDPGDHPMWNLDRLAASAPTVDESGEEAARGDDLPPRGPCPGWEFHQRRRLMLGQALERARYGARTTQRCGPAARVVEAC